MSRETVEAVAQAAEVDGAIRQWDDLAKDEEHDVQWREYLALKRLRDERIALAIAKTRVDVLEASIVSMERDLGFTLQQDLAL